MTRGSAPLLAAYDAQRRGPAPGPLPPGETMDLEGPIVRYTDGSGEGDVVYRDLGGLEGAALDALIARQVAAFEDLGKRLAWHAYGHDRPAYLPDRLLAAGFVPEDTGTIMVAVASDLAHAPALPAGVRLRDVSSRGEFERIAAFEGAVWAEDLGWLADMFERERAAQPERLVVTVAEARDLLVSAAWVRFHHGTEFATLLGGATLAEWRRRGIYRALVAHRASLAAARGFRYLDTDASEDSRPILERLGFVPVTTKTRYIWRPRVARCVTSGRRRTSSPGSGRGARPRGRSTGPGGYRADR